MLPIGCYNNLSAETLRRIKPYAEQLSGREVRPECLTTPITEEQALLRSIGRIVWREIAAFPSGAAVKPMTHNTQSSLSAAPAPQTVADVRKREFAESHARNMSMLSSVFRQLEVLRTNGADVFDELLQPSPK